MKHETNEFSDSSCTVQQRIHDASALQAQSEVNDLQGTAEATQHRSLGGRFGSRPAAFTSS